MNKTINLILLYIRFTVVTGSLAATHLLVTHVGPCDDVTGLMTLRELTITTQTYDSTLSGEFNLTRDVENGWKVKATMQKCQDIRNVDTCDFLSSYQVVSHGCAEDDDAEEEAYGMLFHYANPEIECPISAGVYKLSNYPFFTEDNFVTVYEAKISTSVFGYTYRMDGYTRNGEQVFCVEAYLQLLYMRDHNWLSKHTNDKEHKNGTNTTANHRLHHDELI